MSQDDPLIGKMIQNYQIVSLIGAGGVGRVYLAKHPGIGKKIAVKVLRHELAQNQSVLARFFKEAQSVNEIHHDNVIDIFNLIKQQDQTFILMEHLEGRPLSELIHNKSQFPTQRVANIGLQICSALHATHSKGIIHRDLKPDNIFLINRGGQKDFVKLLDFGLARSIGDYALSPNTPIGVTVGTPAYMSPEQALGDPVDAQTDIYAMGVILYEMVTGAIPFSSANPREMMKQHVLGKIQPPSERSTSVDKAIEEVILRCLQKERRGRYPHMRALALALGYASGLDPALYFQQEQSSQKLAAIKEPPKGESLAGNLDRTVFTSDSEPDLGQTLPDDSDPFELKTDPGPYLVEENPFGDGSIYSSQKSLVLTESMIEAASGSMKELRQKFNGPAPKAPSDSDEA